MNKKIGFVIVVFTIIALFFILNIFGAYSSLNKYVSGTPAKKCLVKSDCAIKPTTCENCDCGDAVNRFWNVYCPFNNLPQKVYCGPCASEKIDFEILCIEHQCQKVWKDQASNPSQ